MDIVGDLVRVNSAVELKCQELGPVPKGLCPHLKAMSLYAPWQRGDWSWSLVAGINVIINVIHSRWCFPVIELGAVLRCENQQSKTSWNQMKTNLDFNLNVGYMHRTLPEAYSLHFRAL